MSTADNEQYRAGFEAWAESRGLPLEGHGVGDYFYQETGAAWDARIAAKSEASTEPIRLPTDDEIERAALKHVAVGWEQMCAVETKMGRPMPNYRESAQFARLKAFSHELAGCSAGAAMHLALDALEVATTPLPEDRQTVLRAQAALRAAIAAAPSNNSPVGAPQEKS